MTDHTYTREDMARAWDEGHERGAGWARVCAAIGGKATPIPNPYEQEEA